MFNNPRLANALLWLTSLAGLVLLVALVWGPPHRLGFQALLVTGLVCRGVAEWGHARAWWRRRAPPSLPS